MNHCLYEWQQICNEMNFDAYCKYLYYEYIVQSVRKHAMHTPLGVHAICSVYMVYIAISYLQETFVFRTDEYVLGENNTRRGKAMHV